MPKLLFVLAVAVAAMLAAPVSAQTVTIVTEGGFGLRVGSPLSPVGSGIRTDIDGPQPGNADIRTVQPYFGRSEFIIVSAPGAGGFVVTTGVVGAGWIDAGERTHAGMGVTTCKPSVNPEDKPECEIKIGCELLLPCATWNSTSFSLYREVMPVAGLGWRAPGGSLVTFGARPFFGWFDEAFAISDGTVNINEWSDALGATFIGALATTEVDLAFGGRFHLLLSGGAGGYRYAAHEERYDIDLAGTGFRAQMGAGMAIDLGDRLSLGLMGRVDWWSVWPGVATPTFEQFRCMLKQPSNDPVCEPPRVLGTYGADVGPAWNASLAVRLSLQLGG